MTPVTFRIARGPDSEGNDMRSGFVVDEVENTFVIDQRYPAEHGPYEPPIWAITHLPSGRRLWCVGYTQLSSADWAAEVAQNFYREAGARGLDLKSASIDAYYMWIHSMSLIERDLFWKTVTRSKL